MFHCHERPIFLFPNLKTRFHRLHAVTFIKFLRFFIHNICPIIQILLRKWNFIQDNRMHSAGIHVYTLRFQPLYKLTAHFIEHSDRQKRRFFPINPDFRYFKYRFPGLWNLFFNCRFCLIRLFRFYLFAPLNIFRFNPVFRDPATPAAAMARPAPAGPITWW